MKNRFQECRKAKGYTLKQAGAIIGVADSTLSLYESDHRTPDIVTAGRMAETYDVTIDYLLGLTDNNLKHYVPPENEPQPPSGPQLDSELVNALVDLTPQELQNLISFAAGMRSARTIAAVSAQLSNH